MTTIANKKDTGFTIAISCPGCGGQLELADNFFAVTCDHCGSAHRILMPDSPPAFVAEVKTTKRQARYAIDRYLKDLGKPLTGADYQLKRMYFPYWKIDAVLFRVRKGIEKKVVMSSYSDEKEVSYETKKSDISLSPYTTSLSAGMDFDSLPKTLGLRSDYLKLSPLSDDKIEDGFDILPVLKSWDEVRDSLHKNIGAIKSYDTNLFGVNKTEIFSPKAILLYFPFFIFDFYDDDNFNRFVIDGVTGRVLNQISTLSYDSVDVGEKPEVSIGEIAIVPHRCTNCGEDLPTDESLVYICKNCQVITDLEPAIAIDSIQQVVHNQDDQNIFVPFWAFTMKKADKNLLKSVFGGIHNSDRIVIPAFRVHNFNAMYKLAKRMSAAYPQFDFEAISKLGKFYANVNLPLNEASSLTELFIKTDQFKKNISHKNIPTTFDFEDATLFYLPFRLESYFYVDSVLQAVTFEKKLIS